MIIKNCRISNYKRNSDLIRFLRYLVKSNEGNKWKKYINNIHAQTEELAPVKISYGKTEINETTQDIDF
ncbi:hypothetical protein SporoP33_12920 [Sporosarcina sp. P33]|nr:hypothetical protein SporoP33_12920 [Sporosarcina sp. P33]